jgi:putative NIF3 family GTP cyclohydrolase 1 type 2
MAVNTDEIDETMALLIAAHPLLFRGEEPAVSSFLPVGWHPLVDKLWT